MASKSSWQIQIEKIDADIRELQAVRARLVEIQKAQPKRKTRAKTDPGAGPIHVFVDAAKK